MVDAEKRALVVHVVARAMEVDDAQILWEEIEERSDPFEMQVNDAAEAFADALIAATTQEIGQSILTADGKSRNVFGDRVNYLVYR